MSARVAVASEGGAFATLRRGLALTPELRTGLAVTVVFAVLATVGRVVVPIAVQQTVDRGLMGEGGPDLGFVRLVAVAALATVVMTAVAAYFMNTRLFRTSETALASLRVRAFRHIHDLSVLTQNAERRGSLVSRVTSDIDSLSRFVQWGGVMMLVSIGQLFVATIVMAVYSWQLTLLVWACFLPLFAMLRVSQRHLSNAYSAVRERVGTMLSAIAESVVGAQVVRAYGIERRTQDRIDTAVVAHQRASTRAQTLVAFTFSTGELVAGIVNAAVVVVGVLLGVAGDITLGRLLAFLFLVTLFVAPMQMGTEILNEAQNAIAGWRRVLAVLDTPADVADRVDGVTLPPGPVGLEFQHVSYAYPGGPEVLRDVTVAIVPRRRVAVVGETGSGKTTFAKLATRLMDPTSGVVLLGGVNLASVRFASLRHRVVIVPQDGYLFDMPIADNVRYGLPSASDADVAAAFESLGLGDWLATLPKGVRTPVGQRGESLSAGERQLVALARAYVADPDLLVLDEATSAVDPATEMRIARALEGVTRGRTSVTIAHRMSTAETADEVLVFDAGRLVERGVHVDLVAAGGVYARLYAAWTAQRSASATPAPVQSSTRLGP
jgi:ATP-binding cassette, subfamily B, bacterial